MTGAALQKSAVVVTGQPGARQMTAEDRTRLLRLMMVARVREQEVLGGARTRPDADAASWRAEPIGVGAACALGPDDRLIAPTRYLAAHLARAAGKSVGSLSSSPDLVPQAVGVALALSARGDGGVVLTLLDEAALAADRTREAITLATERRLPLVLVSDGRRFPATGARRVFADGAIAGQPLLGEAVDRDDPEAVLAAVRAAVERTRAGRGTTLVSCLGEGKARGRRRRHARSPGQVGGSQDPIERYARRLLRYGMPRHRIAEVLRAAEEEVIAWRR